MPQSLYTVARIKLSYSVSVKTSQQVTVQDRAALFTMTRIPYLFYLLSLRLSQRPFFFFLPFVLPPSLIIFCIDQAIETFGHFGRFKQNWSKSGIIWKWDSCKPQISFFDEKMDQFLAISQIQLGDKTLAETCNFLKRVFRGIFGNRRGFALCFNRIHETLRRIDFSCFCIFSVHRVVVPLPTFFLHRGSLFESHSSVLTPTK